MYDIPYHKAKDEQDIREFIQRHPFAYLSTSDASGSPVATQLPLILERRDGREILRGHIMKGTEHHKALMENEKVLVVFNGAHCYVSGTWYSNPNSPSTWNYMSVQVRGRIRFVNEAELKDILQTTSLHFENEDSSAPTVFANLPEAFKERTLTMIVGFEMDIISMDSVFKLSQDRDESSYDNIIAELRSKGASVIADEMERRKAAVFPS